MTYNCAPLLLLLLSFVSIGMSLPTSLMEDAKKADQVVKSKSKQAQEALMFGNQQNRPANNAGDSFTSSAEKRGTVASAGLGGLKAALAEDDKSTSRSKEPNFAYEHETYAPYDRNYDYGKVVANEVEEDGPRVWDVPSYSRYYTGEDRRKRSDKSMTATARPGVTLQPPTNSFQVPTPTQQSVQAQIKRSVPFYQEPRYKRELSLDIDPEDVLTLLSLWENERRNGNWRKYANEEYENMMDDNGLLDEEDVRNALPWLDAPVYPSRHYGADALSASDIGIIRTHPPSYYEQYGNQLDQQYGGAAQYGTSQYGFVYPQRPYYPQEKRFIVSKKRAQSYDPYTGAQLQLGSQSRNYQYPHRIMY